MIKLWEKQFTAEHMANYFYKNSTILHFIPELRNFLIANPFSGAIKRQVILFCTDRFLRQQFTANQYLEFSARSRKILRNIYKCLFNQLEELPYMERNKASDTILKIEKSHYKRLRSFLKKTNPFYSDICKKSGEQLPPVVCDEYSAQFQLKLFHLQDCTVDEISPLLDIGCGEHAFLVKYLRKLGTAAYGFDRMQDNRKYLRKSDWFEFNYGTQRWQTIISNLSFSSHFRAALCRKDGTEKLFLQTYMKILESLKIDGQWLYAPSLPEIELNLPHNKFEINVFPVNEHDNMTCIKKITI